MIDVVDAGMANMREALEERFPRREAREQVAYITLYDLSDNLLNARRDIRERSCKENWRDELLTAKVGRRKLDALWGIGGEAQGGRHFRHSLAKHSEEVH